MDPVYQVLGWLDPVLIAPYRWPSDPLVGWWLGTTILALWCILLGEATLALVHRINRRYLEKALGEMGRLQEQSIKALEAGDKTAYQGINKLANDAHGKAFFLQIAMGSSSLWPIFFAAAWLDWRFAQLTVTPPVWGWAAGPLPAYLVLYIFLRILLWRIQRRRSIRKPFPDS
jgi:hypothetical protein